MITNEDLYEQYGNDIIFLFKGDEPYTEEFGCPLGVLIEKDNKVLCNECGKWFGHLSTHIAFMHKEIGVVGYREKYGFNRNSPLCSRDVSKKLSVAITNRMNDPITSEMYRKNFEKCKVVAKSGIIKRTGIKQTMQRMNGMNSCPEQMKHRFEMVRSKFGGDVSCQKVQSIDSGLVSWACKNFGSWNGFVLSVDSGASVNQPSVPKEKADLVYDLREYVEKNNVLPWSGYTNTAFDGFQHGKDPYKRIWGSFTKAMFACGVVRSNGEFVFRNERKHRKYIVLK